ncbi:MAG TPA: glycosyltransferase family 39 protein, partial [Albitalea sp.]|nr:glycosyltransferase family 39 protein [Albitalea sp.]
AVTLSAIAMLWRFLCAVRGASHATIALLAMLCVTYYNGRLYYYNHNVVLMWFVVATALLAWAAFERRQLRWWALTGVAIGLGALAKYQIAVTVLCLVTFHASQGGWKDRLHRRGLLLAALLALLVLLPHLWWLPRHDFAPIHYAMDSSLAADLGLAHRLADALQWSVDQLFNRALPALALLAGCALWAGRAQNDAAAPRRDAARAVLLCWGLVPLVFMPMTGIVFGSQLQLQWGTPFLLFLVPAVMELLFTRRWATVPMTQAWRAFAMLQGALIALSIVTSPLGPRALVDTHWRSFDAPGLAHTLLRPAHAALGGPVRVIVGSGGEPGALALLFPERPLVLIDGRYDRSPWVQDGLVQRCGALEIVHALVPPAGMTPVGARFPALHWGVIAPEPGQLGCH